jgi:hypothetical protein
LKTATLGNSPIPSSIPLATGKPSGGKIPDGTYTLNAGGPVNRSEKRSVLTHLGGYLTESTYAGGRLALGVQTSYWQAEHSLQIPLTYTTTPTPPPAQVPVVGAVSVATQAQVNATLGLSYPLRQLR